MESRGRRKVINMTTSVLKVRHFDALQCYPDTIPQLIIRAALVIRLCSEFHGLFFEKKLNCLFYNLNEIWRKYVEGHLFCPTPYYSILF